MATSYVAIAVALIASTWCWWHIRRSHHSPLLKLVLTLVVCIPYLGPFLYLFVSVPPKGMAIRPAAKESAFLKRWNEREHIYLGWASFVFWALAVLAYWMNDWRPGEVHYFPWLWAHYTDVDVLFYSLLIGAVLTFGAAVRARVVLRRKLSEASNSASYSDTYAAPLRAPSSARKRGR